MPQEQVERHRIERQRPDDHGDGFAYCLRAGDGLDDEDDGGDRRIDQPRPVHQEPAAGPHAILMQVEPALAGNEVAHLDQPQPAVIVGVPGEIAKAADRRLSAATRSVAASAFTQSLRQNGCLPRRGPAIVISLAIRGIQPTFSGEEIRRAKP